MEISRKERCEKIFAILCDVWKETSCDLLFDSPFQLLVASVLAARTQDETVNRLIPRLLRLYPDARSLSQADESSLIGVIQEVTYPGEKAKNLIRLSNELTNNYQGIVPHSLSQLLTLSGVGRKSASLVCVEAFGEPAIPVDTHVMQVCRRTHICVSGSPLEVERVLMTLLPKESWRECYRRFVRLGKEYCHAQNPTCSLCPVKIYCEYASPSNPVVQLSLW